MELVIASHWYDDETNSTREFTPPDHQTYTAHYIGKPTQVNISSASGPAGTNIKICWEVHPNSNVSYKVYRIVKDLQPNPVCVATLNHNVTSYTDPHFKFTSGYTDNLLKYDIREYYSVENTYADPEWIPIFGECGGHMPKRVVNNDGEVVVPENYALCVYPNPFNPTTNIRCELVKDAFVTIKIYNIKGQQVTQLLDTYLQRGGYDLPWNATDDNGNLLSSGIYFARIVIAPSNNAEKKVLTQRLIFLK